MTTGSFFYYYTGAWLAALVVALAILVARRRRYAIGRQRYWRFLLAPWKLLTFLAAAAGLVVIAPYTGDPTWDYVDAAFMSALTYCTAPWALGVLYRALRRRSGPGEVYVALCLWMFSASWSYDLYLWLRDGAYPITWAANIAASSVLYACAGLMWNLDWRPGHGVVFAFMEDDWPSPPAPGQFRKVVWFALPLMIVVAAMILPFLIW